MSRRRVNNAALSLEERAEAAMDAALSRQQISELRLLDQFSRIGGNNTPQTISLIIQEADTGKPARLVDLLHEARQKSGHLHGVMQAFELEIQELEFAVQPPKNPTALEKKAAELCTVAFEQAEPQEMIGHLAGEATWFGYSHSEIVWRKESRQLWPGRFNNISCRRFGYRQSDGALLFDLSGTGTVDGTNGLDLLEEYPAGKIIQHTPRINGDVRVREGLARCLVWMAMFANWTVRDWLQLAEMAWKPKGFGKYQKGAGKDDRAALRQILQQALATGYAIYNGDTTQVDLVWPQQSSTGRVSPHKELITYFAQEISKAALGNPTVIEPGENGARSSDEIRERMTLRIRDATAKALAAAIQRYYVVPFYQFNYGTRARVGRFGFITAENADLASFGTGVKALREAGHSRIPLAWVNDQVGIPEAAEDEPVLGGDEPPDGSEQNPEQPSNDEQQPAANDPGKPPQDEEPEPVEQPASDD